MGNKRLTQVKLESNMEDYTPLRSVHNLFFLFTICKLQIENGI